MATHILTAHPPAKALRRVLFIALPVAAAMVAYFATRPTSEASQGTAGESSRIAVGGKSQPVMLSTADARRIGVTFAVAAFGDLSREIRVVGQIAFDETRVKAISPKIDGWVEQLYVNFTVQSSRAEEIRCKPEPR